MILQPFPHIRKLYANEYLMFDMAAAGRIGSREGSFEIGGGGVMGLIHGLRDRIACCSKGCVTTFLAIKQ